ncbi:hypothetical protein OX283_000380 [Flavobacterium sp. SUN052]|uniref:hypothetical protein n=1 Tax=Flavobacterium sp. SUN052 TaxID=3002441 RepID=UPI00237DD148|nr:hypothetical protein [Flavobacterium sp. SUN052]MEC4003098.1 hypothetical protein [Flavobacterium sp. SUN052]
MRNFTIYLALSLCLFASKLVAQESFESKARAIATKIENITNEEKQTLKVEVEAINVQLEKGVITKDQADAKKKELAEARATIIENRIAVVQMELKDLIQQKVDGNIKSTHHEFSFDFKPKNDTIKKSEKRTTSQFVFAAGVNNLATDGKVAGSDFRYWGSHFYEWGTTYNTRILKNNNLLHLKYGYSVMYNNLRPTDNRVFVKTGDQTNLQTSGTNLEDSRFRNVYLVAPLHLEFDFSKNKSKDGKAFFQSHQSVRLGLGGYAGLRIKSKQFQEFEDVDGNDITVKEKGDFNVNNFVYGVSAYLGYKETSLYVKYDLNPMFENNVVKQNNISLGVRFDFN